MRVLLLAALTLDGKLARTHVDFVDWSSREDKRLFMQTTKAAGVLILGHNTYKTFPAPLPGRLHIVLTHTPADQSPIPGVVEFTNADPRAILADLAARGHDKVIVGGGGAINRLFLTYDLIDEIWLTVEPVIFGTGVSLFAGAPFERRAQLIHQEPLGPGGVHLRYSLR